MARNLSSLGAKCTLISFSGDDISSKKIDKLILKEKNIIQIKAKLTDFETPTKTRYINNYC